MSIEQEARAAGPREGGAEGPGEGHVETEMAALAARFINSTDRHVFLTGRAGTGKTTFLHRLAAGTHKRHVVLAPTGIAALNAKGVTVHSQFLLPFGAFIPERQRPADIGEGAFHDRDTLNRRHPLNAVRRNVLREVDLLVIDEVSMLRADLLDAIDHRMRTVRGNRHESFGGAQVLLIGDLYQLPPVVRDEEWQVMRRYYASMHFFESRVLKEHGYVHIELDRIFRQRDDNFIRILNNLRDNRVEERDVAELNAHLGPEGAPGTDGGVITLTTHNHRADEINQQALAKLPGRAFAFDAEVEGDFPKGMQPVQERIELKEGAQVMFVKNDADKAYFNGKLARVEALGKDGITVRMYDGVGDAPAAGTYKLKRETWENKRYVVNPATKEQEEEVLGTFAQYPVKLAWAITVHKSQGLTFSKAVIDVGRAFAPGQVYVALSRLRSLDGLILRTRIDPGTVSTDPDVVAFTRRGAQQEPLPRQLQAGQRDYLQRLLTGTFELGDLLRRTEWARKDHPDGPVQRIGEDTMKTALEVLGDALRAEEVNTRTFQGQLMRLLAADRREELLARIEKGGAYYGDLLQARMKDLLWHMAQVEQVARTKEYLNALREIDGMLMRKVVAIAKAGHITACVLEGREVDQRPEIERGLAAKHADMVGQAQAWAQEHRPPAKAGKKRKRRTAGEGPAEGAPAEGAHDGPPADTARPAAKLKGETYLRTYVMVKEGLTAQEIAAARGMSRSTIEGHMARGIAEGVLDIDGLMPAEERDLIADRMRENPQGGLNGAREHFRERFSYGQLRIVEAWVRKEAQAS